MEQLKGLKSLKSRYEKVMKDIDESLNENTEKENNQEKNEQ